MRPLKDRLLDLNQVSFWDGQEGENVFKVTCEPFIHRFLDFTQDAYCAGKEQENEFPVPGEHLKNRFLYLPKFNFGLRRGRK